MGEALSYDSPVFSPGISGLLGYHFGVSTFHNLQEYLSVCVILVLAVYPALWKQRRKVWMGLALWGVVISMVYMGIPTF